MYRETYIIHYYKSDENYNYTDEFFRNSGYLEFIGSFDESKPNKVNYLKGLIRINNIGDSIDNSANLYLFRSDFDSKGCVEKLEVS